MKLDSPFNFSVEFYNVNFAFKITRLSLCLACVASVPVRAERNRTARKRFFAFGPREKWGESKKVHIFALASLLARPNCSDPIFRAARMRESSFARCDFIRLVRERLLRRLVSAWCYRVLGKYQQAICKGHVLALCCVNKISVILRL